eukprot:Hpha_TRINITY_DN23562_c0_g1::TRINITY_DN23562_c0_g1_i1::g.186463::m.186463
MGWVAGASRTALGLFGALMAFIGFQVLLDPHGALGEHAINFAAQPPSALAELRAYYFGTCELVACVVGHGAWANTHASRRCSLAYMTLLLLLFVVARGYSHRVDGFADLMHSKVMWAAEAVGALIAVTLYLAEGQAGDDERRANKRN